MSISLLHTPRKSAEEGITAFFDKFASPEKKYPVKTDCKIKKIALPFPSMEGEVLYRFKEKSTGKKLIGVTSDVRARANRYVTSFRHPEKDIGKSSLAKAVQKNALQVLKGKENQDFDFGVLLRKEDLPKHLQHLSMADIEKLYINYEKTKGTALFNRRSGGGGGQARTKMAATKEEVAKFVKTLHKTYKSPKKFYQINRKNLRVELTPSAKGNVYVLKRKQIKQLKSHPIAEITNRYIGKTERPKISSRMAEHSSYARHGEKELGKKPLYRDIRNHPEEFEVQLIDTKQFETDDLDLIENGLIQYYKEKKASLYNKNKGGGGGYKRA